MKKNQGGGKKKLAQTERPTVSSTSTNVAADEAAGPTTETQAAAATAEPVNKENKIMADETIQNINLSRSDKQRSTQMVVYTVDGRPGSVRFSKTLFVNKAAPEKINAENFNTVFAGPRVPRAEETKEERKARIAAMPKPTAAEKVARLEAKLAKLRAKVEGTTTDKPADQTATA